jgi:hypothetical protein
VWDSATVLDTLLAADGIQVDRWTGAATTDSQRCDYGLAIDWVRPADPESATCTAPASQAEAVSVPEAGVYLGAGIETDDFADRDDFAEEAEWDVPAGTSVAAPARWSPDPNDVQLVNLLAEFWRAGDA